MVFKVIRYKKVTSTNDVCQNLASEGAAHGTVVVSEYQEFGRGQRGNTWESEKSKNLTFSILTRPTFLSVVEQFYLSKITALSVTDWISAYIEKNRVKIKWPNDIYVDDKKIAGILIENSFSTQYINTSIIGIGININQDEFSDEVPNPTSLKIENGNEIDLELCLAEILECFKGRFAMLEQGQNYDIDKDYLNRIYRKDKYFTYLSGTTKFEAKIVGVEPTGELVLQTKSGEVKRFAFKEIGFVI
ncbi:MAG: BirA family transcriptional regulator [Tenuifilum sp.]|uniref:biotin--[acetyl-CoA-carboxylase] ligase n=1 Tax=Tenuifilum sp. TaxID=2760880 RepID=UPI0024AB4BE9|nr:biotin--[acetyl-CoA-carboxylase] ligase [Tenuifilum sp.]MDI3526556.1 BirA family transcriptional regulator [Tenuifilum sp.]